MSARQTWTLDSAIEQIRSCDFECEAGGLEHNIGWQWLVEYAERLPNVAANVRLIASAPDLLEAVIQYRDDLKRPPTGDSLERRLAMVNAAIAKATGAAS